MCISERVSLMQEGVAVLENTEVSPDIFFLRLKAPKVASTVKSGQFVHLRIDGGKVLLRRPLSICQTQGDELHIYYAVVGEGTRMLSKKTVGDISMDVLGPVGTHWPDEGARAPLLIGGGLGTAPLGKLAHAFRDRGIEPTIIQGAQSKVRLIAVDVHQNAKRDIQYATDDGSHGYHGFVTDLVKKAIAEKDFDVVYICGPEPMQHAVSRVTQDAGLKTYVSFERRMACGIGACLGCMLPTNQGLKRVCVDGPVFEAGEVLWDEAIDSRIS